MNFLTFLGVTEILYTFRLVLEGKMGEDISQSSTLKFLEMFSVDNVALSDAENNTSMLLNRGGIADLHIWRILLTIRQKSREPSFWEVMESFFISIIFSTIITLSGF